MPERTRHLDLRAVAAAWGLLLLILGVAAIIDGETGAGPPGLPLPPGAYLALAAPLKPCGRSLLQAGVRGLVAHHEGGEVHKVSSVGASITISSGMHSTRCRWMR